MSSFIAKKLDMPFKETHTFLVKSHPTQTRRYGRVTAVIRRRIEAGGERLWRLEDFADLPFTAVAQALSRLARAAALNASARASITAPGKQRSARAVPIRPQSRNSLRGAKAFSLRASPLPISWGLRRKRQERARVATSALSLPRKLVGRDDCIIRGGRRPGRVSPRRTRPC